ncbi:serine/arginine repetitive matrix protein 1-like [Equus quagga]|uniref:serine/arginine repetitive matrix protein 1-like n=1 Tax=Equus quagga TaxID=89248 RepID=UPI001EE25285|nr:serine/arginine repetitive matrix protein 1-like [Equus quagga]
MSPTRSVRPSSRGCVLPAPVRMQGEFAPPNVGPGLGAPTHRLAGAGFQHLDLSLNFPRRTRSRGMPPPTPTPTPIRSPRSRPQRGCRFTCSRLFRGSCCSSRVRTQTPPGGTLRRCRRCCHRQRHRRCRRRAYPELQRRRSPAAAGGAILGACGTARGSAGPRSRHPTASPCPGPARTGARSVLLARLSQLRRAGDPPSLQDGRGFPPSVPVPSSTTLSHLLSCEEAMRVSSASAASI